MAKRLSAESIGDINDPLLNPFLNDDDDDGPLPVSKPAPVVSHAEKSDSKPDSKGHDDKNDNNNAEGAKPKAEKAKKRQALFDDEPVVSSKPKAAAAAVEDPQHGVHASDFVSGFKVGGLGLELDDDDDAPPVPQANPKESKGSMFEKEEQEEDEPVPEDSKPAASGGGGGGRGIALFGDEYGEDNEKAPETGLFKDVGGGDDGLFGDVAKKGKKDKPNKEVLSALKITDGVDEVQKMLEEVDVGGSSSKQASAGGGKADADPFGFGGPSAGGGEELDDDLFAMASNENADQGDDEGFDVAAYISKQGADKKVDLFG